MICVDPIQTTIPHDAWPYSTRSHLFDSEHDLTRLRSFAAEINLLPRWFQDDRRLPHYDLTKDKRRLAIKNGACEVTSIRTYLRRA